MPEDFSQMLNASREGWLSANGLKITRATVDEVTSELEIKPMHLQYYGVVHGGVYSGIIETLASVGAALTVLPQGKSVVGLENHTSFLHAVRSGVLRASAKPLTRGRRSQVWEGQVFDESGKLAATGRVRLLVLEPSAELAGETVRLKGGR